MEVIRKPLVSTPNRKRERREEGQWQTENETKKSRRAVPCTQKTQSGIGSFLVPLNVEQRKKILESGSSSNKRKISDMSASPKLKPRRKAKQTLKMKGDVLKLIKVTQGEELIPRKNSVESKLATRTVPKHCVFKNTDNNNPVSRRLPYSTEPLGSATAPEMAPVM